MSVIKLDSSHIDAVQGLFRNKKYMGLPLSEWSRNEDAFNTRLHNIFCSNYLSGINDNFHAYGWCEDGVITALISFYESSEEPAWYYTLYRSDGSTQRLSDVLDAAIAHNEERGRLKFYTLVNSEHSRLLRRFHWSDYNNERYGYFDEYVVPPKNKCFWVNAWDLLYKRTLIPESTTVRCNFLKQEYRDSLPAGGHL